MMKGVERAVRLASLLAVAAQAYAPASTTAARRSAFVGTPAAVIKSPATATANPSLLLRMDCEEDVIDFAARYDIERIIRENAMGASVISSSRPTLDEAEAEHGMPWKSSIDPDVSGDELLYMKFWEWQTSFMKDHLSDLQVIPCSGADEDFSYNENAKKKARIVNVCAKSAEYRKIRMTYYDAGHNTQVFNSVWYPDPKYNLPILGIDLLAFNRKKYLAIVDFQPIHDNEHDHAGLYEHLLQPIKDRYESLKGRMSSKFYDETQFFSKQMLFARFEDEDVIDRDLFPAFQSYVEEHLRMVRATAPNHDGVDRVLGRQKEYDTYSAERDPATGLFAAMFGNDWAQGFVHDFLFSMSERKEGAAPPAMPFMGGGGPPGGSQEQQREQRQDQPSPAAPAFVGSGRRR